MRLTAKIDPSGYGDHGSRFRYRKTNGPWNGLADCINKLGEYEDAEEAGRLIKLPCKVGDTVYWLDGFGDIRECKVTGFYIYKDYFTVRVRTENGYEFYMADDCFDKFVFTAHEEAKAALKGAGK